MLPAASVIYTLSLHDALPICGVYGNRVDHGVEALIVGAERVEYLPYDAETLIICQRFRRGLPCGHGRSEEHTSELQSRGHLVCRLLLEKKNNNSPNLHACDKS